MSAEIIDFPDPEKYRIEFIELTPELAEELLELNSHNRPIPWSRVHEYADEICAGRWQANGDSLKFDKNRVMLDGQSRCHAVIRAGRSIWTLIVWGLEPQSQITMDIGKSRTPYDQLNVADIKADALTAAAMRVLIVWLDGRLFGDQNKNKVRTGEIVAWAKANQDWVDRINLVTTAEWGLGRIKCRPSMNVAVAARFWEVDPDAAEDFFGCLVSGVNLSATSPIYVLRERFGRIREQCLRPAPREYLALYIMAWNAWRDGKEIVKLQRPKQGWTKDNFPIPR